MRKEIFGIMARNEVGKHIYFPIIVLMLSLFVPRSLSFSVALYLAILFYTLWYFGKFKLRVGKDIGISRRAIASGFRDDLWQAGFSALSVGLVIAIFIYLFRIPAQSIVPAIIGTSGLVAGILAFLMIIIISLAIVSVEELFWRGLVQHELVEKMGVKPPTAILLSAALFGIWNANGWFFGVVGLNLIFASFVGAAAGWLLNKTERLTVPIYMRVILNVIIFTIM